jgi:excinuclease ABC subunit A
MTPPRILRVRGARVHNLKNIDLDLHLGRLIVITGVSGSGKSSLALDTLYAEGQRRYVESLSSYARQFLERMAKPDVDRVSGIPPAIAVEQKNPVRTSRSTVGTATEIHDFLRMLYARAGEIRCDGCARPVRRDAPEVVVEDLLGAHPGKRAAVAFPLPGAADDAALEAVARLGFRRLLIGGRDTPLDEAPRGFVGASVVVDRLLIAGEERARLAEALETAYAEGAGRAFVRIEDGTEHKASAHLHCPYCDIEYDDPAPLHFSFNSPLGACAVCRGFGDVVEIDAARVVPDPRLSIAGGAVEPWTKPAYRAWQRALKRFARAGRIPLAKPWSELTERARARIWDGDADFPGIRGFFEWLESRKYKLHVRVIMSRYRGFRRCAECGGTRLAPAGRRVLVGGLSLPGLCAMTIDRARESLREAPLGRAQRDIGRELLNEIDRRLAYLEEVGLDYLTLDRASRTLSGGEAQRIQLASSLGTSLTDTLYILDEPSIGLHARDNGRLIGILKRLRDLGNTVVVVEHDRDMMEAADHLVDLGPGAGEHGGRVVFEGPFENLEPDGESLTGRYLRGDLRIAVPERRRPPGRERLVLRGVRTNNLKGVDVEIPLRLLACVTGVSGSGKSSLVHDTLHGALLRALGRAAVPAGICDGIEGAGNLSDVVLVDQSPIGRTPRSNPVTYMKAFDGIRSLFAATPSARAQGLAPKDFSFNVDGGRCPRCRGDGHVRIEMQFLADVHVPCDACGGSRYQERVLQVKHKGLSIAGTLELTVTEALARFAGEPAIAGPLWHLAAVGLGYLRLGQPATTLSGGEAQRLKLARILARRTAGRTLYLFDEPTTGLHFDDIAKLLEAFERLLEAGHSVLVIEHNLDVIARADYIIDLGPEGGDRGGEVVAAGPPERVAEIAASHTGRCLASVLAAAPRSPARWRAWEVSGSARGKGGGRRGPGAAKARRGPV